MARIILHYSHQRTKFFQKKKKKKKKHKLESAVLPFAVNAILPNIFKIVFRIKSPKN